MLLLESELNSLHASRRLAKTNTDKLCCSLVVIATWLPWSHAQGQGAFASVVSFH